jgi:hypothetical protein
MQKQYKLKHTLSFFLITKSSEAKDIINNIIVEFFDSEVTPNVFLPVLFFFPSDQQYSGSGSPVGVLHYLYNMLLC